MNDASTSIKKAARKPSQTARVRRMTVRQLRECLAGITPCSVTQSHILVERQARARQMLENMVPVLVERADGSMEPRGYPATTAALLQVMDANDEIEVLIRPSAVASPPNPLPLLLELNHRIDENLLKELTGKLFNYWRACGAEKLSVETIAKELAQSPTTYMRKVGWIYSLQDADEECAVTSAAMTVSDLFSSDSEA
jgi:hypothetical protein